jgi:hypothetical protein
MAGVGVGATSGSTPTWMVLVVGAAIGLALGVVVSIATAIPLAPEVGLLLGLFAGWLLRRKRG